MFGNIFLRRLTRFFLVTVLLSGLTFSAHATDKPSCGAPGVALQILGSGGPIADDDRASSGYLVWINGESKFLIDTGGGVFLRFAEASANFSDLDLIGISHFHADHSADLPALLKSGNFANRKRSLLISGPGKSGPFPGLHTYLHSLLNKESGAYGYLSGYLDGSDGLPLLDQSEVELDQDGDVTIFKSTDSNVRVDALYVPHGIVPALAYRIDIDDMRIVFASDQNGSSDRFVDFAKNADILVMHMPVPEGVSGGGRQLHAPPSVIGEIARRANAGNLVLSHFMARSLSDLDKNVSIVRSHYNGRVLIADDLDCIAIEDSRNGLLSAAAADRIPGTVCYPLPQRISQRL